MPLVGLHGDDVAGPHDSPPPEIRDDSLPLGHDQDLAGVVDMGTCPAPGIEVDREHGGPVPEGANEALETSSSLEMRLVLLGKLPRPSVKVLVLHGAASLSDRGLRGRRLGDLGGHVRPCLGVLENREDGLGQPPGGRRVQLDRDTL